MIRKGDLEYVGIIQNEDTNVISFYDYGRLMLPADKMKFLKCGDICNAYFQGEPLNRVLLLSPPRDGLQGKGDLSDAAILARVPIYGTKDAGRRF